MSIVDKGHPAYAALGGRCRRIQGLLAVLLSIVLSATLAAPAAGSTSYLSGSGSDRGAGTACSPWRTIRHADRMVRPGDIVYVGSGTYGARGHRTAITSSGTAAAPISWRAEPGSARPVVKGQFLISGDHNHVAGILFQGPTGSIAHAGEEVLVWINADGVVLERSEVRDGAGHAGIFVSEAHHFAIRADYVHHNGVSSTVDQGVYVYSGSGTIQNSLITGNRAWGVQLYPLARNVIVNHDTIVGNGHGGVVLAGAVGDNLVANSIVAGNGEYGIHGFELSGAGNLARNNLLWDQPVNDSGPQLRFAANRVADPDFVAGSLLRISALSPAVNAGGAPPVSSDFVGAHRVGRADIGAYEYGGVRPRPTAQAPGRCR